MKLSRPFTRRSFIKSAAVAGAAPFIMRSNLWAADTAPDKQIGLGFIGQGMQGSILMGGFLPRKDVRVLAVCDVDTTRRELAKKRVETEYAADMTSGAYKGCADYSNFEELLARKDIDGVVIATPNHWHALLVIAAAKAGKDIYCEKPMNYMVREGRAMVKAVRAHHRILQVGSMQRSMTEFRTACELVRNGIIGTVNKVDVAVGGPGRPCDLPEEPAEPGLDWDRWLGPAPMRPYNSILSPRGFPKKWAAWRSYIEYGGGDVYDWGAHHFDIVQWAFGFDETGPIEIIPAAQPNAHEGVRLRYANGLEVTHMAGNGITFYGDKGKINVNRGKFQLWIGDQLKADNVDECSSVAKELLPANAIRLYHSTNHLTDWLNCIRTRTQPICDVETGNRTATICALVDLAYYHNQDMKWDPKTEQFTDGTGDPKWLTRDYRKPWVVA
ncbi:MAG TPA: Gfo/Idh/MocA family oxidoreductase [Methylomirabilota bacterium]|nr:Gfo/Idh/MocA family oxidoreductase [Methylomirabilota bacterium]